MCEPDLKKRRLNESGYCDKEYDAMLQKAVGEVDLDKRKALFKQAVAKLLDDSPVLPIGFTPRFFTQRDYVKGLSLIRGATFNLGRRLEPSLD